MPCRDGGRACARPDPRDDARSCGRRRPAARPAATAAARPTVAAAPNINWGPPVQGVCVIFGERVLAGSSVGQAINTRMNALKQQVQAELQGEQTTLQNDAKALDGQRASLTQDQLQQRGQALQGRADQLDRKAQIRQRELELTVQKALGQVQAQLNPIVAGLVQQRNCGILLNGEGAVVGANAAMDLSDAAIAQLNQRMPSITFDRERLETTPAAAGR